MSDSNFDPANLVNQATLRETSECPCYRLVHPLRPGDLLPDHICRLTMQHSCHEYLIQNHGALAHSARIPIRFDPGGFGMIELETADEWPWASVGGTKSVLMVLQQIVEHKASSKTPALLRNHEQWPQAKRALHAILRMVEMACVVKQWRVQNPQSSEIPASLVESLQPPPLYVPDISLEEEEEWNQVESPEDAGPGPLPAFLPLLQETDIELAWPALPPLSGPLGLSKDGLREAARQTLRSFNLSDSIGAADLLLSEVLPAALSPPAAPSALPDSLCVTSFLLGDTTLVITASTRAQEEYNILVETAIDPARGAARRRAWESHSSAPLSHGGETIFQITGS